MTPHEHAQACMAYAAWRRRAFAALAPLVSDERQAPARYDPAPTAQDLREVAAQRQELLDACGAEARQEHWFHAQNLSAEILAYLRQKQREFFVQELADIFDYSRQRVDSVLRTLKANGQLHVRKISRGNRNDAPYCLYSAKEAQ